MRKRLFRGGVDGKMRLIRCGIAASILVSVLTHTHTHAHAHTCASALDCNLNGECRQSGNCTCYAPWTGASCGELSVLPVPPTQGYGTRPNVTSWGGSVVYHQGLYHMYVAEMVEGCPLADWGTNSRVTHAVATSPEGPYVMADVALDVWAHNPAVVAYVDDNGRDMFALFHIGDGTGGNPKNCSTNAEVEALGAGHGSVAPGVGQTRARPASAGTNTLHSAPSPYGTWTPVVPAPPSCNNPAPMLHPNGTWYLLCDSVTMYSAPALTGPWSFVCSVPSGGVAGTYEDAFLYLDQRGNWHVLYHVYNATTPCGQCLGDLVSGHSFSPDGFSWQSSTTSPFGNVVQLTTGSSWTLATRERPKLLFMSNGTAGGSPTPTHLVTAACGGVSSCPPTPGVNCKYDYWDFTLVQPLAV